MRSYVLQDGHLLLKALPSIRKFTLNLACSTRSIDPSDRPFSCSRYIPLHFQASDFFALDLGNQLPHADQRIAEVEFAKTLLLCGRLCSPAPKLLGLENDVNDFFMYRLRSSGSIFYWATPSTDKEAWAGVDLETARVQPFDFDTLNSEIRALKLKWGRRWAYHIDDS
jgi:hypothetical protein